MWLRSKKIVVSPQRIAGIVVIFLAIAAPFLSPTSFAKNFTSDQILSSSYDDQIAAVPQQPEMTDLERAAFSGDVKRIKQLLKLGVDPNEANNKERLTALMIASIAGRVESVEALLNGGAKMELEDRRRGLRAFHFAAMSNKIKVAKILLQRGEKVDVESGRGYSALCIAI